MLIKPSRYDHNDALNTLGMYPNRLSHKEKHLLNEIADCYSLNKQMDSYSLTEGRQIITKIKRQPYN